MALVAKAAAFEILTILATVQGTVLTGDEFPSILLVRGIRADCAIRFALCGDVCQRNLIISKRYTAA